MPQVGQVLPSPLEPTQMITHVCRVNHGQGGLPGIVPETPGQLFTRACASSWSLSSGISIVGGVQSNPIAVPYLCIISQPPFPHSGHAICTCCFSLLQLVLPENMATFDAAKLNGLTPEKEASVPRFFYHPLTCKPEVVEEPRSEGKTAIVTGSNTGVGLETVPSRAP